MMRPLLVILALLLSPLPGLAQEGMQAARNHTVVPGETLWDLARRYYGNPFDWRRIYEANTGSIENPHWIYPGQELVIPGISGAVTQIAVETRTQAAPAPQARSSAMPDPGRRTVFYRSPEEQVGGIQAVTEEELFWVTPDLFDATGWIDPSGERHPYHTGVIDAFEAGENLRSKRTTVMPHDLIRVTITGDETPSPGDEFTSFRIRDRVRDVGMVAIPTGIVRVVGVDGDAFVAELLNEFDFPALGDYVVPRDEFPLSREDRPQEVAESGMEATVVAFQVPNQLNGRGSILFLDKGAADGVSTGDVFELRVGGGEGWSGKVAGRLIVHRVKETSAAARVMQVNNPVFFRGTTVKRVARMD